MDYVHGHSRFSNPTGVKFADFLILLLGMSACAASEVAQIGSKKYTTLDKAFSAAKNGQTITLKKNTSINGDLKLNLGKKSVTLNLNKKKLAVNGTLNLTKGSLTITGNGTVNAKQVKNAGSLSVKNGTINGSVYNTGKFTLNGGKLKYSEGLDYAVCSKGGSVTMTGGTITYAPVFKDYDQVDAAEIANGAAILTEGKAIVNVSGGKIVSTAETVMSKEGSASKVTLSGGTFQSANAGCIAQLGNGTITITGGNYSIKGCWGLSYVHGNGTLNIKNGTLKSEWTLVECYSENSRVNISGGTLTTTMTGENGSAAMLAAFEGKINVTGGTLVGKNDAYVCWKGGGTINVSEQAKIQSPNLWKETEDVCG